MKLEKVKSIGGSELLKKDIYRVGKNKLFFEFAIDPILSRPVISLWNIWKAVNHYRFMIGPFAPSARGKQYMWSDKLQKAEAEERSIDDIFKNLEEKETNQ
jgi:nucleoside diphosphate kinase